MQGDNADRLSMSEVVPWSFLVSRTSGIRRAASAAAGIERVMGAVIMRARYH